MTSNVQGTTLQHLYLRQGALEKSVVLHAWKKIGKWGAHDPSGKDKRAARTAVYICAGTWGALELLGRGVAAWTVRNSFSKAVARSIIPIFVSKENAKKAEEDYKKTSRFVAKSFDECLHGTSQCFLSIGATHSSYEAHVKSSKALKDFLDRNEIGPVTISVIEALEPALLIELLIGILSADPVIVGKASLSCFVAIVRPILEKEAPSRRESIRPVDFTLNEEAKINMQKLLLLHLKDLYLLTSIPPIVEKEDEFFGEHLCPITQKPIRFIKEVKAGDDSTVFYENEAIAKWFLEHPETPPPAWPENVPYEESSLQDNLKIQLEINARIEKIIQRFRFEEEEIIERAIGVGFLD
jgi:hypothetical protein